MVSIVVEMGWVKVVTIVKCLGRVVEVQLIALELSWDETRRGFRWCSSQLDELVRCQI